MLRAPEIDRGQPVVFQPQTPGAGPEVSEPGDARQLVAVQPQAHIVRVGSAVGPVLQSGQPGEVDGRQAIVVQPQRVQLAVSSVLTDPGSLAGEIDGGQVVVAEIEEPQIRHCGEIDLRDVVAVQAQHLHPGHVREARGVRDAVALQVQAAHVDRVLQAVESTDARIARVQDRQPGDVALGDRLAGLLAEGILDGAAEARVGNRDRGGLGGRSRRQCGRHEGQDGRGGRDPRGCAPEDGTEGKRAWTGVVHSDFLGRGGRARRAVSEGSKARGVRKAYGTTRRQRGVPRECLLPDQRTRRMASRARSSATRLRPTIGVVGANPASARSDSLSPPQKPSSRFLRA